jgi:PmbA protein
MNLVKFALKEGADDVIIESNDGFMKQVKFANNSVVVTQNWSIKSYDVFISYKKRLVSATLFDTTESAIKESIRKLIKNAKVLQMSDNYYGIAEGPFKYKAVPKTFDKRLLDADTTDIVESAINAALKSSNNTAGILYTDYNNKTLESSNNVSASEKSTSMQLSIRAFNADDESGHAATCSRMLSGVSPEELGARAGEISKMAKSPEKANEGKYDVVFAPMAMANLLNWTSRSASSFMVDSGFSFLKNKLNKAIANPIVNIIDDGRMENGYLSSAFDAEGVPTTMTPIIENGILKNYLHNTSTAKKYGVKTTANAGLIDPVPSNTVLKEGKITKEKLLKSVENGIYVTNVWYSRFQNYLSGDFSTIPRDGIFLIKNGEIVKSLKGIRITDNLQRILGNITGISNSPEWVIWWGLEFQLPVLTPHALVKNVNITMPKM